MSSPALPPPRETGRYRIALVCLGNICRSPMAHVVLADRIAAAGLEDRVDVVSSGTGDWHVGGPMDPRAAATLRSAGYDGSSHRARQVTASWLDSCDVLLAMDRQNLADVRALTATPPSERIRLFGEFDPETPDAEVPDPYHRDEDGFAEVLAMVERTADVLVAAVESRLSPR